MRFVCGTVLNIPFIPLVDVETLLARGREIEVRQITPDRFGPNSIDAAILKIMAQGPRAEELGIRRLDDIEHAKDPRRDIIPMLHIEIDLENFANEFDDYAARYYSTPEGMPTYKAVLHAICHGELDLESEAYISDDNPYPLSSHAEIERRAEIDAAFAALSSRRAA